LAPSKYAPANPSSYFQTVSEKLFGNPQSRARRLTIKRIIAA
jgi:hypothetical protein